MLGLRRMSTRLITVLSTLFVLATSAVAHAQAIHAAALPPVFKNNTGSPELQAKFQDLVLQGLAVLDGPSGPKRELGEVLNAGQTRDQLGDLQACGNDPSCLPRITHALAVNRLFTTEVTVSGKSYTIAMRVYDGSGRELSQSTELCDICTLREAEALVTKTAQKLATVARTFPVEDVAPPKRVEKTQEPAPTAPTPIEAKTPPKQVEPVRPPPTPEEVRPMAPPSTPSPLEASNPQAPTPAPSRRYVPWRILGFSAVGLGVVGFAVGIPLIVIDGRPTCSSADATHTCPHVYNTKGGGIAMTALGAISIAASVPLFYFDYKDRHPKKTFAFGAMPTWGGAAATIAGRF